MADRWVAISELFARVPPEHLEFLPDGLLFQAIVVGKTSAMEQVSDLLIEKPKEREGQDQPVRWAGAMPDSEINVLAIAMVDACVFFDRPPPKALVELLRSRLEVDRRSATEPRKSEDRQRAIHFLALNPEASRRKAAQAAGVHASTVTRWLNDPDFKRQVAQIRFLDTFLATSPI